MYVQFFVVAPILPTPYFPLIVPNFILLNLTYADFHYHIKPSSRTKARKRELRKTENTSKVKPTRHYNDRN